MDRSTELRTLTGEILDPAHPDTPLAFPVDFEPTIPVLLRRAVDRFGDLPFLVTSERSFTFADIEVASRRVARHLVARGVGKGTRVGMLFPQGPGWVTAFLAAARVGALVMPFSTFYTPSELARSMRHGDVELLLVPETMFEHNMADFVVRALPGLADVDGTSAMLSEMPFLRSVTVLGEPPANPRSGWLDFIDPGAEPDSSAVDDELVAAIESEVKPADLLVTIYTSGTTNDPKGVIHTHGSQIRHGANLAALRRYSPECRLFAHMPFFWVGGFTCTLIPALHTGAVLITQPKLDAGQALDLIQREQATHLVAWPNVRKRLMAHPSYCERDLSDIPFLPSVDDPVMDPGLMHNSLGMTETSGPHTAAGADEFGVVLPEEHRGSFGRRVPYVQHRIADPETNETVDAGSEGEVCIRGYTVMAGMYKREREDVFDADGWYHTGDRAHFEDDLLFFHGRYGEMIKTAGSNVAPREVEVQLERLGAIKTALVFGLPDEERGEVVAAALVAERGHQLDTDEILAALQETLSVYKVPRHLVVLAEADVPLLGSGKPDRRRVRAGLADRLGLA